MGTWGATYFQKFGSGSFDMSSASGYMGAQCVQEFGPICLHMSSASGYMSATRFQEFAARFLKKNPQLAGTWVQNNFKHAGRVFLTCVQHIFRTLVIYIYI